MPYRPPLDDIGILLLKVLDAPSRLQAMPAHAQTDAGLMRQVLDEAGKFVAQIVVPLQRNSDRAQPATPTLAAGEPAPRAGSRLVPGGTAPVTAPVRAAEPVDSSAATSDDPIDAMTRALIDQAWLRGVDLR